MTAPPTGPPVTQARTFVGTTRANSPTSCSGDSHDFDASEGSMPQGPVDYTATVTFPR
jgi:hypothetical protein